MKRKIKSYPMGSISSGTMLESDLIPCFIDEMEYQIKANNLPGLKSLRWADIRAIKKNMEKPGYYDGEECTYDLDFLFDALEEFAAPYFYFGANPGDGADYGFWLSEEIEYDFDGLKVSDLSEVPKDYRGEVLYINDHGNMTLYVKNSRGFKEIWGIV